MGAENYRKLMITTPGVNGNINISRPIRSDSLYLFTGHRLDGVIRFNKRGIAYLPEREAESIANSISSDAQVTLYNRRGLVPANKVIISQFPVEKHIPQTSPQKDKTVLFKR